MSLDFLPIQAGTKITADLLNQLIQAIQDGTIFVPGNVNTSTFTTFTSRLAIAEAAITILQAINGQLGEREQFVLTQGQSLVNLKSVPAIDGEVVFLNGKALARTDGNGTRDYQLAGRALTLESSVASSVQAGDLLAVVYQHPISPVSVTVNDAALQSSAVWVKKSVSYTDCAVAGTTAVVKVASLPANSVVDAVVFSGTVPFEGPGVTGVNLNSIILGNVQLDPASPGSSYFANEPAVLPLVIHAASLATHPWAYDGSNPPEDLAAGDFNVSVTSTSGNLNLLTRGTLTVWIRYSVLP